MIHVTQSRRTQQWICSEMCEVMCVGMRVQMCWYLVYKCKKSRIFVLLLLTVWRLMMASVMVAAVDRASDESLLPWKRNDKSVFKSQQWWPRFLFLWYTTAHMFMDTHVFMYVYMSLRVNIHCVITSITTESKNKNKQKQQQQQHMNKNHNVQKYWPLQILLRERLTVTAVC